MIIAIIFGCSKENVSTNVPVLGHAATGLYNPQQMFKDNTAEAVEYALSFEALAGIEIDIQLSNNQSFWLYHDDDLGSQTSGSGAVGDRSDEYLEGLSYATLNKERLAALEALQFDNVQGTKIVFLDLKFFLLGQYDNEEKISIANKLKELINEKSKQITFIPIVRSLENFNIFKESGFEKVFADVIDLETAGKRFDEGFDGVFIKDSFVNSEDVAELKTKGEVILFELRTVNSIKKAMQKNPDFLLVHEFRTALAI